MELEIPSGIEVSVVEEESLLRIKGRLGSTEKRFNTKFTNVSIKGGKLFIEPGRNAKLKKRSELVEQALSNEARSAFAGVQDGIEQRMEIVYAHFPISVEVKGKRLMVKNLFGRRVPTGAGIVGDTKIEIKGQELMVKGVDNYDVGQTVANIRKACAARGYDSRVFQDGIYKPKAD